MSKHTYGFPADTDRTEAVSTALAKAREDGHLKDGQSFQTSIGQTDEHLAANELCVVIRVNG